MKQTDALAPFLLRPRSDREVYFSAVAYLRPELDLGWTCFCRLERDSPTDEFSLTIFRPNKTGRWHDDLLVGFYRESFHPQLRYGRRAINDPFEAVKLLEEHQHFGHHALLDEFLYDDVDCRMQSIQLKNVVVFGVMPGERRNLRKSGFFKADGVFVAVGHDNIHPIRKPLTPFQGSYAEFKFRSWFSCLETDWRLKLNQVV